MIEDYLAVWRVLNWIDYDTFLDITQFEDNYYSSQKWNIYREDYTRALLEFDSVIRSRFDDYVKEQL